MSFDFVYWKGLNLEACLFVSVFDDGFPRLIEEEEGHGHNENKFNEMIHVGITEP